MLIEWRCAQFHFSYFQRVLYLVCRSVLESVIRECYRIYMTLTLNSE